MVAPKSLGETFKRPSGTRFKSPPYPALKAPGYRQTPSGALRHPKSRATQNQAPPKITCKVDFSRNL
jgi:hypothetical protein